MQRSTNLAKCNTQQLTAGRSGCSCSQYSSVPWMLLLLLLLLLTGGDRGEAQEEAGRRMAGTSGSSDSGSGG